MTKVQAKDHESYTAFTLVSLLIPIIGFVMGAVYLTREEKLDKKMGEHLIITAIMGLILFGIIWAVSPLLFI